MLRLQSQRQQKPVFYCNLIYKVPVRYSFKFYEILYIYTSRLSGEIALMNTGLEYREA